MLPPCTDERHFGRVTVCTSANCKTDICTNCVKPGKDGKMSCLMCQINTQADLQFEENEEDAIRKSAPPTKFTSYVNVKMDEKGNVTGWESLFKLLEAEDAAKAKG